MASPSRSIHIILFLFYMARFTLGNNTDHDESMNPTTAPYIMWNISYGDELQLNLDPVFSEQSEMNRTEGRIRSVRRLEPDEITHKINMFFYKTNELNVSETFLTALDPEKFSVTDFIIRLQEKYDANCHNYLDAVPEEQDNYFIFDDDIVNIENPGDTHYKGNTASNQARRDRAEATFDKRYRIYGEECVPKNEWMFWRDMFLAAENDTIAIPKTNQTVEIPQCGGKPCSLVCYDNEDWFCYWQQCDTSSPPQCSGDIQELPNINNKTEKQDDFTYIPIPPKVLMNRWNKIWMKYEIKGICNPQLLLECQGADRAGATLKGGSSPKCQCRTGGVGLPSVIKLHPSGVNHEDNSFVTQYYDDVEELVFGKESRKDHYGKYVHKQMCVFTASMSFMPIANPCDLSLPMIGMCLGNCVANATCNSVSVAEKEEFAMRYGDEFRPKDPQKRIQGTRLRSSFSNKCECEKGKICEKIPDNVGSMANIIAAQLPWTTMTLIQIIRLSFC